MDLSKAVFFIFVLTVMTACGITPSPEVPEMWKPVATLLDELAATDQFSGAVLIAKDGLPVLSRAYGTANQQQNLPNTVDTRFNVGSLGKTVTAVAIGQLFEQGKIAFSDPIGKYISGFPDDVSNRVTIHHLLTHTSGMGNYMPDDLEAQTKGSPRSVSDLMQLIIAKPLQFQPGAQFGYSNSGYVVLGAIVESVTGQSYYSYVRENIFKPAGMTRTDWFNRQTDTPDLAIGYMAVDDNGNPIKATQPGKDGGTGPTTRKENTAVLPPGNPSGGTDSTVGDLLKFAQALMQNKLLRAETREILFTSKIETGGPPGEITGYGYGFAETKAGNVRVVWHNGGAPGLGAELDMYPDLGYTVILLTNYDMQAIHPVMRKTRQALIPKG